MNKANLPLIIGLSIPVIMVAILAAVIYIPKAYIQPEHDFIYAVGDYPIYTDPARNIQIEYTVSGGKLLAKETPYIHENKPYNTNDPEFFRYSVTEKTNTPLAKETVQQLALDPSSKSPDGFELGYARSQDNIFESMFGGRDYSQRVLKKDSVAVGIELLPNRSNTYYDRQINLVGWVIN